LAKDYRATRNFESEVPIELKADITWLAEYSRQKFCDPLAQYDTTGAVGSGGLLVFGCNRQRPLGGWRCYFVKSGRID
jgi:hypothetical protein